VQEIPYSVVLEGETVVLPVEVVGAGILQLVQENLLLVGEP